MIPFHDFGGDGPLLHLAHANGYPPLAYTPLARLLASRFHVVSMLTRPLWPDASPADLRDWSDLAEDLIRLFDEQGWRRVVGVGHSMGSILTLLASVRRPALFRALVLIDPVIHSRRKSLIWSLAKRTGLARRIHPYIEGTLRRRRIFASADEMFANYRAKPIFAGLSDEALRWYVAALARPRADGQVELAYPPEWEAWVYANDPHDMWTVLPMTRRPLLVIYGEKSAVFTPTAVAEMRRVLPQAHLVNALGAGHLVPLEKPGEVAESILEFTKVYSNHSTGNQNGP